MPSFFVQAIVLSIIAVSTTFSAFANAGLVKRAQLVFPPTNGPCRQNHGLEPLQCTNPTCIDVAASGVCHIQTQDGLPICGCCDSRITLLCSACGGDAGGGICKGTGFTEIAYQGCPCNVNGGAIPDGDKYAVCPEHAGSDTQACSASTCGGSTRWDGICDTKTDIGGGYYQFCACCPEGELACDDCGGDKGNGHCRGVEEYPGTGYDNCKCNPKAKGKHPVIIPFPVPPPGFPVPPPGTPNPETPCSEQIDINCADCNGKDGWCQQGPSAGCPCDDGRQECPEGDDIPDCSDAICGGATNTSVISSCLGANGKNKDCLCFQFGPESEPYAPFTEQQLLDQDAFLESVIADAASSSSTSSAAPPSATGKLTCSANSASQVPKEVIWSDGNKTPNQVLYTLREVICNNKCEMPAGLPAGVAWKTGSKTSGDCEVAVAIEGNIEVYFYRGTESTGDQWQQCWDATDSIIKQCVNEGPNTGWVNGPNPYQFYQGGFRPLNDPAAVHLPMSGDGLQPTTAVGSVSPTKLQGFTCGSGSGGTRPLDCLGILGAIINGQPLSNSDTQEKFCTDDSTCLKKGQSGSSDGKTVYSSYCEVASNSGCSFVIASKLASFGGFPGKSCVSPKEMSDFIRLGANECGPNSKAGVWAAGFKSGETVPPYTVYGLVDSSNPGAVFVP